MQTQAINIVGAGLAGSLLAVLLARRGFQVSLYDRRPDPRGAVAQGGRSINLALATRGIRALEHAGVMDDVRPLLIEMRGRMVHERSGETRLLPYGWKPDEVIHSVGRSALTQLLVAAAARHPNVSLHFNQACVGASVGAGVGQDLVRFRDLDTDESYDAALTPTIATDGAGSVLRVSLAADRHIRAREDMLDHDYKELTIPPANISATRTAQTGLAQSVGPAALEVNALHVWPRGGFMLIALPNTDGSFTATLFLARTGVNSFETLKTAEDVQAFFAREFADALSMIPNLATEFFEHPQGRLGTVHAAPWHAGGKVLLLGDAAHAIVPFHGQGMNAAFEDCTTFDELLDQHDDWAALFAEFDRLRRPDTEAIAQMALENYIEMRDTVLDPRFQRYKVLSVELERRFPDRFIPRYSMVMFHPEISYAEALRRGAVQAEILAQLDAAAQATAASVDQAPSAADHPTLDVELARSLIQARLTPLGLPSL
ncbi:MAG TPA: NAD(P)/FAD-dependent oxidoreductase [Steroidobacteraceae bacterium]|jgi:kynurenine 3-monooxygenase|nr:NAD(P)/FAD-dependent oxidoreductase [Steroidobacteraceae bacterium]